MLLNKHSELGFAKQHPKLAWLDLSSLKLQFTFQAWLQFMLLQMWVPACSWKGKVAMCIYYVSLCVKGGVSDPFQPLGSL